MRKLRVLIAVVSMGISLPLSVAANAQGVFDVKPIPSCKVAMGNIFDARSTSRMQQIDGRGVKDAAALAKLSREAKTKTLQINGGSFAGWDFSKIELDNVCFNETDLSGSNWAGANASGIGFVKAKLDGANLSGASMPDILLRDASLKKVNASKANWAGGKFDGGWFEGSTAGLVLDDANLTGFHFDCGITLSDGCPVFQGEEAISAKGTNFTAADIHSFSLYGMAMDQAIFNRTVVSPGQVSELPNISLQGPVILAGGDARVQVLPNDWLILAEVVKNDQSDEDRPSFKCKKAKSVIEKEICGDGGYLLRAQDRKLAKLYKQARSVNRGVRSSQRAWMKQRAACASVAKDKLSTCLSESYDGRIGKLAAIIGEPQWLLTATEMLFVDDVMPVPEEFRQTALFAKITPALAGSSWAQVVLTANVDGSFDIAGSAVGANAHTCTLGAKGLRLDRNTGWFSKDVITDGDQGSAKVNSRKVPVFRIANQSIEVFRNGKVFGAEAESDDYDFVSCGMRASFPEMRRLVVSAGTLGKIKDDVTETY